MRWKRSRSTFTGAGPLADRAAVLVEGRERIVAPCAELLGDERIAALYLGRHTGKQGMKEH